MILRKIKLGPRLTLGFLLIVLIFTSVGIYVYSNALKISENIKKIQGSVSIAQASMEMKYAVSHGRTALMEMLDSESIKELENFWKIQNENAIRFNVYAKAITEGAEETDIGKIYKTDNPELRDIVGICLNYHSDKFLPPINKIYNLKKNILNGAGGNQAKAETRKADEEADAAGEDLAGFLEQVELYTRNEVVVSEQSAEIADKNLKMAILVGVIVAAVFAIFLARLITVSIVSPTYEAMKALEEVSGGNLSTYLEQEANDEMGIMIGTILKMVEKLRHVISEIQKGAEGIASAAKDLSSTAQTLSQGATEEAASIEETSASIEEIQASIAQNSENAEATKDIAQKSSQEVAEGEHAVNETVEAMRKIAGNITVIEEISYQTNLLALNAAIEAARAGQEGKGFAVVAQEVRKLAERSQTASQEIGKLAADSVKIAEAAGNRFLAIVPNINKTSELISRVSGASGMQRSTVDQVSTAVNQLNIIIQNTAASSEELAGTSEELEAQASMLKQTIGYFRLD